MDENVSTRIHSHPYIILFRLVEGKKNGWLDKIGLKIVIIVIRIFCFALFCIGCCKQLLLHQIVYT